MLIIMAARSSFHRFRADAAEHSRLARETYISTLSCEYFLHNFRETSSLHVYDSRT
jgi:hypothetical protein